MGTRAGASATAAVALCVLAIVAAAPAAARPEPFPARPGAAAAVVAADPEVGGTLVELPVVVPELTGGVVARTADLTAAHADADVVAADRVVAPDRLATEVVPTPHAQTIGVTWPGGSDASGLALELRVKVDGAWSSWREFGGDTEAPDAGTADDDSATRGGTEAVWIGDAEAVQLSLVATQGVPADLSLVLVGSNEVPLPADAFAGGSLTAQAGVAAAASVSASGAAAPALITRDAWGAAPQVCTPDVASTLVGAVVHHTAGSNSYATVAEAMQQIRNDQRYHIEGRGWCDIGYNFVVDKWGNVYEGRANSAVQPVIGVHAGGFNTGTVGISMLGTYGDVAPPAETAESVARIVAWRLGQYHRDPAGSLVYHTLGGENSRYPSGVDVPLPVVFGHRDVAFTACPGEAGFAMLPGLRLRARHLVGASFINPTLSPSPAPQGTPVTLRAATLGDITWQLAVSDARTGNVLWETSGVARAAAGGMTATWDGRNAAGHVVGSGPYAFTLTGVEVGTGVVVVTSVTTVTVTGSQNPPTVTPVPLVGDLHFVPVAPVRLLDTRTDAQALGSSSRIDMVVAGVGGVPADAKAVAVNITAVTPTAITFVRAWPAGQDAPATSVLNADRGRAATAAGTIIGVGGEGKISLWNNAGSTHLVVDVTGYYTTAGTDGFGQLATAVRALDTRTQGGPMSDGALRTVTLAGTGGIPADAQAVVVNVTSVASRGNGYVSVVPAGAAATQTSSVNHLPGGDVSNRATVPLAGGKIDVRVGGSTADVVLDVVGWYGPSGTSTFTPIVPVRAFDTRVSGGALGPGASRAFAVGGPAGLPTSATSALMVLTATAQSSPATFLTAWPGDSARPGTSDLNTGRGRDQANGVVVGLGTGASIQVYNNLGSTHVVGDVYGYFD